MSEAKETAADAAKKGGKGSALRSWKMIALALVAVVAIAGGGYWYLAPRPSAEPAKEHVTAAPPFYLEVKPFVVSIATSYDTTRLVEVGLNLALAGSDAGNAVTGLLPEVQDAMRQTVLAFKVDDIVTPTGVDKLRKEMIGTANRLLLQRLGSDEVKRLTGGKPSGGLVQNIYFSTLIVE